MSDIAQAFIRKLTWCMDMAHALTALVSLGQAEMQTHLSRYPEATFAIGIGHPEKATIKTPERPLQTLLEIFGERDTITDELVHAQVIQYWHDFLEDLFAHLVRRHFTGLADHGRLGTLQTKLNLSKTNAGNLVERLIESATKEFAFAEAKEKLRLVGRALDVSIPDDLTASIKKHITVRNVHQHNDGVLRREDLRHLGLTGAGLSMIDGSGKSQIYHAGDRLKISFWELVAVCANLIQAVELLIPGSAGPPGGSA